MHMLNIVIEKTLDVSIVFIVRAISNRPDNK